ncbi:MAG: Gfo/Idh/MocA family oxidoreductase, partial [Deltaproteobacteria bacterium]|nr:Gfo/Idh/MocA family oxidoreductase [Deltaproteobacteria bacterium]
MSHKSQKPLVAVLGAGYWGRNLVRDFSSLGALKVICDPDQAVREAMAKAYPGATIVDSPDKALADKAVTAVAIATPAPTHAALVIEAINAGKDVFVEKPLALKVEDGEAMVGAARKAGRILVVDHLLNRHPAFAELKRQVWDGQLGTILRIWARRHNFGKIRKDENVSWSFAPHDVAMILGLAGQSPVSVEATGACFLTDGVEDIVEGSLAFESGLTAQLSVSWLNPYKEQKLAVIGDRKMAVFDDTAAWDSKLTIYGHQVNWENQAPKAIKDEAGKKISFAPLESLKEQCRIFLDCAKSRAQPPDSDGQEALEVMKVLLALDRALKKSQAGKTVKAARPAQGLAPQAPG